MSYAADFLHPRQDFTRLPSFRAAVVLSIVLHALVLWRVPLRLRTPTPDTVGEPTAPLIVQLAPPPGPLPSAQPAPAQPPVPSVHVRPPQIATRPAPPPLALTTPTPAPAMQVPLPPISETAPTPAPPAMDLAAYIEARRRASSESTPASTPAPVAAPAPPAEDENARASRVAAANLRLRQPPMGYDPSKSGGVFQVTRVGYDYAEFVFFGWNREVRRDIAQQIEVRKGNHATIHLAIVRKMIEIIREYEQDEFTWTSPRLGRSLKLSARLRDTATLEEFLLREFFDDPRRR
jgi:hypothetical protein